MAKYYAEGTSYNPIQSKTGFRSGDRDSSYNEAKVASNVFAPPATVPLLDGVPNYQADEGGESMGFADRPDAVNQNALNSVNSYNNDINSEENNPTGGMTQANISNPVSFPTDYYGNPIPQEVHGPKFDPMVFVPGGSFMSLNEPAIPTSGYGTPGTYSSLSGGKFNQSSQAVDPYTGQPIAEFGTKGAFLASLMDDPLANTTSPQGLLSDMEYGAQTAPGVNPNTGDAMVSIAYGATDPTGNPATTGYTPGSGPLAAQQLGMQMGLPSHSVAPGTATNQAISTGQVTPGSQYSPTGTFTNAPTAEQKAFNNLTNFSYPNTKNFSTVDTDAAADAAADAAQSAANDAANAAANDGDSSTGTADNSGANAGVDGPGSEGGGGGGGGGGCVVATHGVSTGAFTVMEKAKAELWCQKKYHNKWYGEAFRKGYRAAGLKHVNNGTAPSVYQEFKDFVAYGRGIKKGWKPALNYYYRTITFFIVGLFIGDK